MLRAARRFLALAVTAALTATAAAPGVHARTPAEPPESAVAAPQETTVTDPDAAGDSSAQAPAPSDECGSPPTDPATTLPLHCGGFDDPSGHDEPDVTSEAPVAYDTDPVTGVSLRALSLIEPTVAQVDAAHTELIDAIDDTERARWALRDATAARDALEVRLAELDVKQQQAVAAFGAERERLEASAVAGYVAGPEQAAAAWLTARSDAHPAARAAYLDLVARDGRRALQRYEQVRAEASAESRRLADRLHAAQTAVDDAQRAFDDAVTRRDLARRAFDGATTRLAILQANPAATLAFPVAGGTHSFSNDWGACRSGCSRGHQGTDIMAPFRSPAVAIESGVIAGVGSNTLGGLKLWLIGDSGTEYYYAHFDSYPPGMANGVRVEIGDVIGYVGNTGAPWAPPHLHFQVHPAGGPPINPYPLLRAIADAAVAEATTGTRAAADG